MATNELYEPTNASRVSELIEDGYIVRHRTLVLTAKGSKAVRWLIDNGFLSYKTMPSLSNSGLRVLMACADRPIPHKPRRLSINKG